MEEEPDYNREFMVTTPHSMRNVWLFTKVYSDVNCSNISSSFDTSCSYDADKRL